MMPHAERVPPADAEQGAPPPDMPSAERTPATREELARALRAVEERAAGALATAADAGSGHALDAIVRVDGTGRAGEELIERQGGDLRGLAAEFEQQLSEVDPDAAGGGATASVDEAMARLKARHPDAFLPVGETRQAPEGAFTEFHQPPTENQIDWVAQHALTQERAQRAGGTAERAYLLENLQRWATSDAQHEQSLRKAVFERWAPEDFQRALAAMDRISKTPVSPKKSSDGFGSRLRRLFGGSES